MRPFRIKVFLKDLLRTGAYVLFGLFVFTLTTYFLYRKRLNGVIQYTTVSEADSCILDCPDWLRSSKDGAILLYVETKPCAKCSESIILDMVNSIDEAGLKIKPAMICHLSEGFDSCVANDYYERFAEQIDLVVSSDDSIRIRNVWLPQGLGFYGIVTDSLDRVHYAGSMFDQVFLTCCIRQFGTKDTAWD